MNRLLKDTIAAELRRQAKEFKAWISGPRVSPRYDDDLVGYEGLKYDGSIDLDALAVAVMASTESMEEEMDNTEKVATEPKPRFEPGKTLGAGGPFVVTDVLGVAWQIDPQSGHARKVQFTQK